MCICFCPPRQQFLFQIGAIRSFHGVMNELELQRFYSKLVRLEAMVDSQCGITMSRFYSKLVRLEVDSEFQVAWCLLVSIPNWCDQKIRFPYRLTQVYLVSIPNWCDQKLLYRIQPAPRLYPCFYSKLVRLEGFKGWNLGYRHVCFYSKLVRLEVKTKQTQSTGLFKFLFQIGAIRSKYYPTLINSF